MYWRTIECIINPYIYIYIGICHLFTSFENGRLFIRLVQRNNILHKSVINSVESVPRAAPLTVQTHAPRVTYTRHRRHVRTRLVRPRGNITDISLSLSLFVRLTGVPRHSNCDMHRMHSLCVGNVSLRRGDIAKGRHTDSVHSYLHTHVYTCGYRRDRPRPFRRSSPLGRPRSSRIEREPAESCPRVVPT